MQLSGRSAQRTKDESKKLQMYSKQWLPGDTLRTFYPIFWENGKPEIAVGAVWGHNVSDIKALGLRTAFIPSTTDFDENAVPVGPPDVTYQFSQIARLFVNGQKMLEEEAASKKNWPTEAARKEALKAIEDKYDTKNNQNAIRPIIGKAMYYITTEVVSIKLVNNIPVNDSIQVSSAPLSSQTITRIYALMDDPKFAPNEGDTFFEVEWKYPADSDKSESGRKALPSGLTQEYRLATQFAESYAMVSSRFPTVATNSETIVRRATRVIDPVKVRQALTQYSFMSSEYLDCVTEEDEETLLKHVDLIQDLGIVRSLNNQELITKINAAIEKMNAERKDMPMPDAGNMSESLASALTEPAPDLSAGVTPDLAAQATGTPVAPDVNAALVGATTPAPEMPNVTIPTPNPAAPSIDALLNNAHNAGTDDANIEGVDFGGTMI